MKRDVLSLYDPGPPGYRNRIPSSAQPGAVIAGNGNGNGNGNAIESDVQEDYPHRTGMEPDPIEPMPFPGPFAHDPVPAFVARFGEAGGAAAPAPLTTSTAGSASSAVTTTVAYADAPGGRTGAVTARTDRPAHSPPPDYANIPLRLQPFLAAVRSGNLQQLRMQIDQPGGDIKKNDARLHSEILMLAVSAGHRNIVELLLARGADVNAHHGQSGITALIVASRAGNLDMVNALLKHAGVRLDLPGRDGRNALVEASAAGHAGIVHSLLAAGADVNFMNLNTGGTALMCASANGKLEVVRVLLKCPRIRLYLTDNDGRNPLAHASAAGHAGIVNSLLAAGADVNSVNRVTGRTALVEASANGRLEVVKALLKVWGILIDQPAHHGRNALSWAAGNGHIDVVEHLIGAGAKLTFLDSAFQSDIHHAAIAGHVNVVECLLKHGAPAVAEMAKLSADVMHAVCLVDLFLDQSTPAVSVDNPLRVREPVWFDDPHRFFQGLLTVLKQNAGANANGAVLAWLDALGIRHAVTVPMMNSLGDLSKVWRTLSMAGQASPSDHQMVAYFASTMSRLVLLAPDQQISAPYLEARLSPAGLERLSQLAINQRDKLAGFAEAMTATFANHLLNQLLTDCRAKTSDDLLVDADALGRALINEGLVSPLAKALANSWHAAMQELASTPVTMPQTHLMPEMLKFLHERLASKGPELFVRNLAARLDSPNLLAEWGAMLGDSKAEGLFALFDDQCGQLRQYCNQMSSGDGE